MCSCCRRHTRRVAGASGRVQLLLLVGRSVCRRKPYGRKVKRTKKNRVNTSRACASWFNRDFFSRRAISSASSVRYYYYYTVDTACVCVFFRHVSSLHHTHAHPSSSFVVILPCVFRAMRFATSLTTKTVAATSTTTTAVVCTRHPVIGC